MKSYAISRTYHIIYDIIKCKDPDEYNDKCPPTPSDTIDQAPTPWWDGGSRRPCGVGKTAWSPQRGVAGCNKYSMYWNVLVCTCRYIHVCTSMYQVCTWIITCKFPWTGALFYFSITTAYMSHTQSIYSHSQKSQNNTLRIVLVNWVHTGIYWYVLGT